MESILCAVDLSPASQLVAAWATLFALKTDRPLLLLHAIHEPTDAIHPSPGVVENDRPTRHADRCRAALQALMPPTQVSWWAEIVFGDPAEMIQQYCRTHPVALVVAGSRRLSGLKRFLLGTVVERMARMLPCPLLVVRPNRTDPPRIRSIGVCCDRTQTGQTLVAQAAALAQAFDADLVIFSALEAALDPTIEEPGELPYGQAQTELQARCREKLASMVPLPIQDSVGVEIHLAFGEASDEIPLLVRKNRLDLLLVGVRNRSILGQWMAGSTTEALLRQAPCPVLAVPADALNQAGRLWGYSGLPAQSKPTGIVRDAVFLQHRCDGAHPENPGRLEAVFAMLDGIEDPLPLALITARPASLEELTLVHDLTYVLRIAATAKEKFSRLTPDTYACSGSYETACRAAGAVMAAIDAVIDGRVRNAFVPVRPPGHHAEVAKAMGFCLFNNVALGAEYARAVKGMQRVLVLDWDVHHGNGIQHIFEEDPSVLYISTHQYPGFPGTGHYLETGRGRGEGYTINLPLGKGWGDGDYAALFRRVVAPIAAEFNPDLILVAAGFDIHRQDPAGRMRVTEQGFAGLTRILMDTACSCCRGRLVLILEGGYHHHALGASVGAVLRELSDQTHADLDTLAAKAKVRRVQPVVKRCIHVHGKVWPCLKRVRNE
jgi:acetoin utilization deacetylase AcuC-like enzyme/nucleotide-binding universal stress UspA family protein